MNKDDILDCTCCKHYLLCKKSTQRYNAVCEKFVNIYENSYDDDVPEGVAAEVDEDDNIVVCSGACDLCDGCPLAVPHVFNPDADTEDVCEDVGYLVKPVPVKEN